VLLRGGGWITPVEAVALLDSAGIAVPGARVVSNCDDAARAATELTYPVALKALGPALLHKTERRAVALHLGTEAALRRAYADFTTRFGADMTATLVQQMVPAGIEMLVGAVQDPTFGPLVACGTGGMLVDLLQDTVFRLQPISEGDADEMIEGLRGVRLLRGFRGAPPADEAALRDVLLRVSELVTIAPEIQELDLNPVIVLRSGAVAADIRVRIEPQIAPKPSRRVCY
jgi:acyl-CoA synthetase (NDP forming)